MVKETLMQICTCDGCGKELVDSGVRINDGSWQSEWIKSGKLDICFKCSNQIFDKHIIDKIPEDELIEYVEKLNENPFGLNNGDVLFNLQTYVCS